MFSKGFFFKVVKSREIVRYRVNRLKLWFKKEWSLVQVYEMDEQVLCLYVYNLFETLAKINCR